MIKKIILIILVLIIDLAVYLFLGLMMLNYEDFYTAEEGPWYSLESMTNVEKFIWIAYQGWVILNVMVAVFLVYKFIKRKIANYKRV